MTNTDTAHQRFTRAAIVLAAYAAGQAEMQSTEWTGDRSQRGQRLRAQHYAEALEEYQRARDALDAA